jgi:mannose-1-phosphate guanylyltransferase/mannose-6-phosphate isomerase
MADSSGIRPLILAGGAGARLWPLSQRHMPKQFLPATSGFSTFQNCLQRVGNADLFDRAIVAVSIDCLDLAREQAKSIGIVCDFVIEPVRRDSAAAIAATVHLALQDSGNPLVVALASDHIIPDLAAFEASVSGTVALASLGRVILFGVRPSGAETRYGYIRIGAPLGGTVFEAAEFVEKPPVEQALRLVAEGWLWNSGNLMFRARTMAELIDRHAPDISEPMRQAVAQAVRSGELVHLDPAAMARSAARSIDYAVLEHCTSLAVQPVGFSWLDVGDWDGLSHFGARDEAGNLVVGQALLEQTQNCVVCSDRPNTAVIGLSGVSVIARGDSLLVAARDALPQGRKLAEKFDTGSGASRRVHRPWGWFMEVDRGDGFAVKRICVDPKARLSLQRHNHRSERWIVVRGGGEAEVAGSTHRLSVGDSLTIPCGAQHRVTNTGTDVLEFVEVQQGAILKEDDIERFADDYGRP